MSSRKDSGSSPELASTIDKASALVALPIPLVILKAVRDPDGTVVELAYTFLNEAAGRLYGMRLDQVLGHGLCEIFPSVRELGIWDTYLEVIESGHQRRSTCHISTTTAWRARSCSPRRSSVMGS